jgi:uncharacterized protein
VIARGACLEPLRPPRPAHHPARPAGHHRCTPRIGIGVVAVLMGVVGGELLIPTIVLLFAVDIKIAGGLSHAISPPTLLVAFASCSRVHSFQALKPTRCSSS